MAFVRTKKLKGKEYRYLVENYRDDQGKVRQRNIKYLGAVSLKLGGQEMVTTPTPEKISFEEYLNYDDGTDNRYELVDGELVVMNPPAKKHFKISRFLVRLFEDLISRQKLDIEVFTGIGVRTGSNKARIPDVSVIDGEVWCSMPDDASAVVQAPLTLAVEVVSAAPTDLECIRGRKRGAFRGIEQIERDYTDKAIEYQNTCIPEYWIVDPIEQKITVLVLDKGSYTKTVFTGSEAIASATFPQLEVTAGEIISA
jgi:Uma2 family endonuclease